MDAQFSKFVEIIQKLYINVPLLDALQVSTYAKYARDILNNKRPLPTTKVIKLTRATLRLTRRLHRWISAGIGASATARAWLTLPRTLTAPAASSGQILWLMSAPYTPVRTCTSD
jgi:hypothetical protein